MKLSDILDEKKKWEMSHTKLASHILVPRSKSREVLDAALAENIPGLPGTTLFGMTWQHSPFREIDFA